MSTQVQYRRGTAVENNAFTGAYGEITVDTTNWILRIQDGATAGGWHTVGESTTQTLINKTYYGSGVGLTNIPAGNLAGTTLNAGVVTSSLTAVGALNSGSITGGFGSIDIGTDTVTCGGIVNANANGIGNIGSSTTYFNTVFAKATSAQYADLAEKYTADAEYAVGTVLVIGGTAEVTQSTSYNQTSVAGTVSENPAHVMNDGLQGTTATVALLGRVPCRVVGKINKGDLLVTSDVAGAATASTEARIGSVVGKALEAYDSTEVGTIEIMVGRV